MKLLPFMEQFDGMQPSLDARQEEQAAALVGDLARTALLCFADRVDYVRPQVFGDALPRLTLYPLFPTDELTQAQVAVVYGDPHIRLTIPQPDTAHAINVQGVSTYSGVEGAATRHDIPDASERLRLRTAAEQEGPAAYTQHLRNETAGRQLERDMGLNDCPVSLQEVRQLGALLRTMTPDRISV